MFGTRWRWNASVALAVRRMQNGKRVPPQFQRSDAEDLLTVCFPDQVACAENLVGEREVPDHPLVRQTVDDCLHESMDVDGFERLLQRIESGAVRIVARDLTTPSPLAYAILNAKPYAFLDDGEAEERRTKAVRTRPLGEFQRAEDLGRIDAQAIERVREEAWPEITNADELHDALVVHGFFTARELGDPADLWFAQLCSARRATELRIADAAPLWIAAERLHEFRAARPQAAYEPPIDPVSSQQPSPDDALREILRSRLELLGPVAAAELGAPLGLTADALLPALLALEAEGAVMRGGFSAADATEWCERRLLARMHRYTRDRQRAEIRPVPAAQFMRFLFRWQGLASAQRDERREGDAGLQAVLRQLEGYAAPAAAWEEDLLPARVKHYQPYMLDKQCASGHVVWTRPPLASAAGEDGRRKPGPIRSTPILLCQRDTLAHWQTAAAFDDGALSPRARKLLDSLRAHGASFFSDLAADTGLLKTEVEPALGELVGSGLATCDSFAGLRALIMPAEKRARLRRHLQRHDAAIDQAGRWALTRRRTSEPDSAGALAEPHVEHIARVLLRRYGVVFRKLLEREDGLPPWRALFYVYRRLEARGEIRGGRFVGGFSGEQFALPDAALLLRQVAREGAAAADGKPPEPELISLSAADPLNLVGIVTPGDKVARLPGNRVLFEDGVPVAVQVGGDVRYLRALDDKAEWEIRNLLIRRQRGGSFLDEPGLRQ
jgi:ATP-dependent Lhr-like helicase